METLEGGHLAGPSCCHWPCALEPALSLHLFLVAEVGGPRGCRTPKPLSPLGLHSPPHVPGQATALFCVPALRALLSAQCTCLGQSSPPGQ